MPLVSTCTLLSLRLSDDITAFISSVSGLTDLRYFEYIRHDIETNVETPVREPLPLSAHNENRR
jgi:hypothetical protein